MKPRLLDLFCGAGGCTKGYQEAGFYVVGVDIAEQPNYCGDEFYRHDALKVLESLASDGHALGQYFAVVHASPPCQFYSRLAAMHPGREYPDLIGPVRELLDKTGLPYVIENVKGAPLYDPQLLEGQMFGLNTHRPRLFETNWGYQAPHLRPPPPKQAKMGRKPKPGEAIQVVGHFSDMEAAKEAMGIDWMTRAELAEAIPPAYTAHIGSYLLAHIEAERKAAA